ncbi:MAG: hypothetical protein C0403_07130 [Desulfobacterium sp.]|nr:hypothetical protein [Desulfobacterium sp.]
MRFLNQNGRTRRCSGSPTKPAPANLRVNKIRKAYKNLFLSGEIADFKKLELIFFFRGKKTLNYKERK